MEAHFGAAAVHSASFGDSVGGEAPYLSHLVLSERCLANFGVPTFLLASGNNFYAEVQVRFHGCLRCTQWQRVFSMYTPSRALDRILLPDVSLGSHGRSGPFRIMYDSGNSWGGLFISVPILCDPEKFTFDGYTAVAVRLAICGATDEFYEMLFTYDELAQPLTRFYADAGRFDALALQICEFHIPATWPSCRKDEFLSLRNRLMELIAARRGTRQLDKILHADRYITHEQPLVPDPPREDEAAREAKKKEADDAMKKLKDAAGKVASSDPSHQRTSGARGPGISAALLPAGSQASGEHAQQHMAVTGAVKAVASGLSSIVRGLSVAGGAMSASASQLADSRYTDALLAGLEPPGRSRGEQKPTRHAPDLESVVMADGQPRRNRVIPAGNTSGTRDPSSVEECLKALCAIISDLGTSLQSGWTFGPISVVTHSCYNSGSPILIVTYSDSGKRAYPPIVSGITALSKALVKTGASYPSDLDEEEKAGLLRDAPCFECPLGTDVALEYQKLFSVDSEQVFLFGLQARVTTALITSLTVAVTRATDKVSDSLSLNQIVSYDLSVRDDGDMLVGDMDPQGRLAVSRYDDGQAAGHWPAKLASQAANLIAGFCAILQTESFATFARSGVWKAILTSLTTEDGFHRLPFLAPLHADPAVYLFDYFRFGMGNVSRVTSDPNVIRFKPAPRTGLMDCEFISGAASPAHPWAVHKFLPGQFHSYLCIGLNSELEGLLIFPGGFGLRFDLGETLDEVWDKNLDRAVLERYSRPADIRRGLPYESCDAYYTVASAGECTCPYLRSSPPAPRDSSTTSTSGPESATTR